MFTPASLQRIISSSKNELEVMAPRYPTRERAPNIKAMARLALAGSWPKPKRARSKISSICVPAFGTSQTPAKKAKTHSKFCSPRKRITDTYSRFAAQVPLQRRVCGKNAAAADYISQPESKSSSPTMPLQRQDTESTANTSQGVNSTETSISTAPTTRAPSPELGSESTPKCLKPQGRHAQSDACLVPANSISSSISGRTDETPHCPTHSPHPRGQQIISKEPFTALDNLKRLEREITAYHKALGRGNQDKAQALLEAYGFKICLHTLKTAERIHIMSCIYRRAYDLEASLVISSSKQTAYPRFFPRWQTVDDFDWKYIDHEGNTRPEAYLAMAENTEEEGPFTREELEKMKIEEFRDARFEMGELWWKEVEGWVMGVEKGFDEMGKALKGLKEVGYKI